LSAILTGGEPEVKKFAYFCVGIFLSGLLSGAANAAEFHNVISVEIQRFSSFPEWGGLVVLGSVLIFGATILRRRRAARDR
jgi:hypothetical protein